MPQPVETLRTRQPRVRACSTPASQRVDFPIPRLARENERGRPFVAFADEGSEGVKLLLPADELDRHFLSDDRLSQAVRNATLCRDA